MHQDDLYQFEEEEHSWYVSAAEWFDKDTGLREVEVSGDEEWPLSQGKRRGCYGQG